MKNKNKMKMKNEMKNKNEMKIQKWNKEQQHHKNLTEGSPKQSNIAVSFCLPIKKMMLLILPLYLIIFQMVTISTFNKDNG